MLVFYAMEDTIVTIGAYYYDLLFVCVFNTEIFLSTRLSMTAFRFSFILLPCPKLRDSAL